MEDNVINLFGKEEQPVIPTEDRIDASKVLEAARAKELEQVVIIGTKPNGTLFFASSEGDLAVIHYLLHIAGYEVLKMGSPSE